jgi:two-component system sensor histidine kinase UhpB
VAINLWVTLCFALVTLACAGVLLHQAVADVERELQSAEAVVAYLATPPNARPGKPAARLTKSLRHVRVHWLAAGEVPGCRKRPVSMPGSAASCLASATTAAGCWT